MAAVVIVAGEARRRRSRKRKSALEASGQLDLDADNNGKISPDELLADFAGVHFRADIALERAKLEDGLLGFMQQMPLFLLCLFCFLIAISIISPATETSAIHRHLEAHFGLDQVQSIADVEGIYSFIKSFEEKNRELMPTSPNYWCEHRYFQYQWDDHYMVPRTSCSSHRFTALGLQSAPLWTNETSAGSSGRLATREVSGIRAGPFS